MLRYGGNTPCLSIEVDDEPLLVLDAGTGIFNLAKSLGRPPEFRCTIALTHLHWDHMMGLPFFFPADQPDAETLVLGPGDRTRSDEGAGLRVRARLGAATARLPDHARRARRAMAVRDAR